jgi:hypothetical protein
VSGEICFECIGADLSKSGERGLQNDNEKYETKYKLTYKSLLHRTSSASDNNGTGEIAPTSNAQKSGKRYQAT